MGGAQPGRRETARSAARRVLCSVERQDAYAGLALDARLEEAALTPQDAALATQLVYGVLQNALFLDYQIAAYYAKPLAKLTVEIHAILRIGAYQLLFLDKIPAYSAVNEAVQDARRVRQASACGLVNAVLRKIAAGAATPRLPQPPDSLDALSVRYSIPVWILRLWQTGYPQTDLAALAAAMQAPAPLHLRCNTCRTTPAQLVQALMDEGLQAREGPIAGCVTVEKFPAMKDCAAFRQGLFHVQDLSSQLCAAALGAQPGERVLDLCAAPGGKTFTLAQRMEDRGEIVACDLHAQRVRQMERGAARLGLRCVKTLVNDATQPNAALGLFDRVLCDAPCSGLGVLRRKPEIRYKSSEAIQALPARQLAILRSAAAYVRPGGTLLYSTCALHPAENEGVREAFLRQTPAFAPAPLSAVGEQSSQRTFFPHLDGGDGFYIAAFRREEG